MGGQQPPEHLTSANGFALRLRALGEVQAAWELDEDTLARSRRVLGDDHPDTWAAPTTSLVTCLSWARCKPPSGGRHGLSGIGR